MNYNNSKIILEDQQNEFLFQKSKSNLDISFNRISFIFFIFFILFIIYSIHLIHLGSRKTNIENNSIKKPVSNYLYRADIVDRNGRYLVKNEVTMEIEGQEKPAYIAESLTMYVTA